MFYENVFSLHVYVYFCKTLRYTYTPWVICFSCKSLLWTQLCLGICMYTSRFVKIYICLGVWFVVNENLVFHIFIFKGISIELNWTFSWWYVSHYTCSLTLLVSSWLCFHEYDMGFMDFECLVIMWFTCASWKTILFYFLLEGFRTRLQVFPFN